MNINVVKGKYPIINGKKSHTPIRGIVRFVAVDGEGQNVAPKVTSKIIMCEGCKKIIVGSRISKCLSEFYHPNCYYMLDKGE